MKFTVADLLDQVPEEGNLEIAKLEKILRLTNRSEKQSLELAVQGLTRLGILDLDSDRAISRGTSVDLVEARLRCSSKGFCFAIRDDGGDDIYIRDHQLNHAWNGDRVLVRLTREGGRRRSPEGGIQCILERATTSLLASVEQQDDRVIAVPLDDRLLASIELSPDDATHAEKPIGMAVAEVVLDRYPIAQFPARGHVARSLPLDGGAGADRELMLTKANLHQRPAAPRASFKAPSAKKREDLTEQPTLMISGWTSDGAPTLPAVHVIPHEGGTRLWIHSPAVAERLSPGNSYDQWLLNQSESLCLGGHWIPLLSPALAKASDFSVGDVQDAVSLRLDIDSDGEWRDWDFCLSRIRPVAEVKAEALHALQSRKPKSRAVPAALKSIKDQIGQLETLIFCATKLHDAERREGRIELDLKRAQADDLGDLNHVSPDGDGQNWSTPLNASCPNSVLSVLIRHAHRVWEEHSRKLGLPAILLDAPPADDAALNDVAKAAIALDVPLELDEDGAPTPSELCQALASSESSHVLNLQLRQALPESFYRASSSNQEPGTDGSEQTLSESTVDHSPNHSDNSDADGSGKQPLQPLAPWCCPTLHQADVINQQVLCALLNDGKDRPTVRQKNKVKLGEKGVAASVSWPLFTASQEQKILDTIRERTVQKLNARRRQVEELKKDVLAMTKARSAEPMLEQQQTGVISGVQSYGFFVEIAPSMVEGLVHVSSLNDDWYEYRSRQNRLVGRRSRRVYQLGDSVEVKVLKVDVLRNQIDLEVVPSTTPVAEDPLPVAVSEE
tara:strand:- start:468 stop:2831 length:2364 start_codon:yes stop_codon:yes gene_type:complete